MNFTCKNPKEGGILFTYDDGIVSYSEWLNRGILHACGLGKNAPDPEPDRNFFRYPDRETTNAFILELDGVSLVDHWEHLDHQKIQEDNCMVVRVHMRHTKVRAEVWVCTKLDGSGCFSRWLEVKNSADHTVTLTRLAMMSGKLDTIKQWKEKMKEKKKTPYRLGYFENTEWGYEGQFHWQELHSDRYSFGGRYTRDRFRHPFCVLENRATRLIFAMQMAYSGGYLFNFDLRKSFEEEAMLYFAAELDGLKPLRRLDTGEILRTPELVITMTQGELDDAVYQMHNHIRNVYVPKAFKGAMFLQGSYEPASIEKDREWVESAVNVGIETYYHDATWYSEGMPDWINYVGDWEPSSERYPNGFRELVEYCEARGIRCGLWMEPERCGRLSMRYEEDRDKFLLNEIDEIHHGHGKIGVFGEFGFYNLAKKEVCDYVEDMICKVIEENKIKFFRLDLNVEYPAPKMMNWKEDGVESVDLRYHENFYAMWDRLRKKYPEVVFENCASGGGRTDLGMMRYFDHTWISDHFTPPRRFVIFNGMTMCLPPEIVSAALNTSMQTEYYEILGLFTRSTLGFPEYSCMEHYIEVYKNFTRPLLRGCKMYHHTPEFEEPDTTEHGILEAVSADETRAMIAVFCHDDQDEGKEMALCCKGVKEDFNYRVTSYRLGELYVLSGRELKEKGIPVTLRGKETAELFMMECV